DVYAAHERCVSVDSDRAFSWDYAHARRCFQEHTGYGELAFDAWAARANKAALLAFAVDLMREDPRGWTGVRVLGTVHRGNGFPVWSVQVFARDPQGSTLVYSGPDAPNVRVPDRKMRMSPRGYEPEEQP
ncbi:MAG: hypothetical protein Q8S13_02110, partial [Dehalococcoidia bacterium]|nr:hypothetical protein [Dehalococcoidia bacterium]